VILANLLLLMGFALLSRHFEHRRAPGEMPTLLSDDWNGGFVLLVMACVISSFLDNIAAALIGGTVARHVFRGQVHIGYLAPSSGRRTAADSVLDQSQFLLLPNATISSFDQRCTAPSLPPSRTIASAPCRFDRATP
jgi:hypothetical protein